MNVRSSGVKYLKSEPVTTGGESAVPSIHGTPPWRVRGGAPSSPSWSVAAPAAVAEPASAALIRNERRSSPFVFTVDLQVLARRVCADGAAYTQRRGKVTRRRFI